MPNRLGVLLAVVLAGLFAAPTLARAADEPVATAPIPPPPSPPAAATPPQPDKPFVVSPTAPKAAPPKTAAARPKRPPHSAQTAEHDRKAASRHRPSRQVKQNRPHAVAHAAPPPVRRPRPRPRDYAGDLPPPPPWYDAAPYGGYYAAPWRHGPFMPW